MDGIGAIDGYDLVSGAVVARTRLRKMRIQLNGDHEAAKDGITVTRSRYLSAIAVIRKRSGKTTAQKMPKAQGWNEITAL